MRNLRTKIFQITALTVISLFMSSAVFAQVQESRDDKSKQDTTKQTQTQTQGQEQSQRMGDDMRSQDHDEGINYSGSVQENDLPQEITSSLDELYPAHDIEEIQKGDDDSYKVKVKNQNDEAVVYYGSDGQFLRARNLSEMGGASPQQQGQRTRETGIGTDDQSGQQGQWGTDDRGTQQGQQGTQQGRSGTGSDTYGTQGTEQGTQQGQWGTDSQQETQQGRSGSGTDTRTNQGTQQQGQWGTQDNTNEGSASPQDQNQRLRDDNYGNQGESQQERDMNRTQGADERSGGLFDNDNNQSGTQSDIGETRGRTAIPGQTGSQSSSQRTDDDRSGIFGNDDDRAGTQGTTQGQTDAQSSSQRAYENRTGSESSLGAAGENRTTQGQYGTGTHESGSPDHSGISTDRSGQQGTAQQDNRAMTEGQGTTLPQQQSQRASDDDTEYSEEIQENELPNSVTESVDELYPDHDVEKAYRGNDGSYKLKLKNDNDEVSVFYDSNGLFHREEKLREKNN